MTYTKLIERLRAHIGPEVTPCDEAADAIEAITLRAGGGYSAKIEALIAERDALQVKMGDAIRSLANWQHQCTELQAENEQFRLLAKANSEALGAALAERDQLQAENERLAHEKHEDSELWRKSILEREQQISALQARLDAMGKGDPVAYLDLTKLQVGGMAYATSFKTTASQTALYAAPKALEPSREVIERYMADKGFYLSKEAMDGLMAKLGESGCTPKALAPTVLKPFTPCVCHDDTAKRYCKDKGKCSYFEAHGIGGTP